MRMIVEFVEPFVMEHLRVVVAVWGYLLVGSLFASGVVWGRRRRGLGTGKMWGWLTQLTPPLGLLHLFAGRAPAPLQSPFGEVRALGADGLPLPRGAASGTRLRRIPPFRMLAASLAGGIAPGLGQLAHLRPARAFVLWSLMAFALFFISAHQLGIERTWLIPDWILPADRRGQEASANFRVPGYFLLAMVVEAVVLLLWSYLDIVSLNDTYAERRARGDEGARRLFYNLAVDRPGSDSQRFGAEKESIAVGAADVCDHVAGGDDVHPEHVLFYIHHVDVSTLTLQFRCLGDATVLHNATDAREGPLRPGDTIQVGDTSFRFLSIE